MRLIEFAIPEFRLSESDAAAILAVREEDWQSANIAEGPDDLEIMTCPLFDNTYRKYEHKIADKLASFVEHKKQNPLVSFGRVDYPFKGEGPLSGIHHAHLNKDISVLYKILGQNPRQLRLYGVFTHDDIGTGQPSKIKLQKQTKTRIDQQTFKPA